MARGRSRRTASSDKPGIMSGILANSGVNFVTGGVYKCDKSDDSFYCRLLKIFNVFMIIIFFIAIFIGIVYVIKYFIKSKK
jgi:hypothetical protein